MDPTATTPEQRTYYAVARTYHIARCKAENEGILFARRTDKLRVIARKLNLDLKDIRRIEKHASTSAGQCFRDLRMGRLKSLVR
jgi:flagellar biosynthesis regulator FlbT